MLATLKWLVAEHADVHGLGVRPERRRNGEAWIPWDAERGGQAVARAGRHEAKRRRRASQRTAGFVHRSIAAPHDDKIGAFGDSRRGELARVSGALGHRDRRAQATARQLVADHRDATAGDIRVHARTSERVDDQRRMRNLIRTDQCVERLERLNLTDAIVTSGEMLTTRAARLTLLVLFFITRVVTAYLFWMSERRADAESAQARAFDASSHGAARTLLEVRAAQRAYVAAGQSSDWAAKVLEGLDRVEIYGGASRRRCLS
jgi:hypothetical protein